VNIFIPLVSIEEDGDGTQLWPGTHAFGSDMAWKAPDERAMRHMRSPAIDAGGLMLFECVTSTTTLHFLATSTLLYLLATTTLAGYCTYSLLYQR